MEPQEGERSDEDEIELSECKEDRLPRSEDENFEHSLRYSFADADRYGGGSSDDLIELTEDEAGDYDDDDERYYTGSDQSSEFYDDADQFEGDEHEHPSRYESNDGDYDEEDDSEPASGYEEGYTSYSDASSGSNYLMEGEETFNGHQEASPAYAYHLRPVVGVDEHHLQLDGDPMYIAEKERDIVLTEGRSGSSTSGDLELDLAAASSDDEDDRRDSPRALHAAVTIEEQESESTTTDTETEHFRDNEQRSTEAESKPLDSVTTSARASALELHHERFNNLRQRYRFLLGHAVCLWLVVFILIIFLTVDNDNGEPRASDFQTRPPMSTNAPTSTPFATTLVPSLSATSPTPSATETMFPTATVQVDSIPSGVPTSFPLLCVESRRDLLEAVDIYLSGAENDFLSGVYGLPIGTWCVGEISDFSHLFSAERNGNAATFDEDISAWNMSRALDLSYMFSGALSFSQDLSEWDISSCRNISHTFASTQSFNGDITTWDTSSIVDMSGIFFKSLRFNRDISSWNIDAVETMEASFYEALSFSQDISSWRPQKVLNMNSMFFGAGAFSTSLCKWLRYVSNRSVETTDMFVGTSCPTLDSHMPIDSTSPPEAFCHHCDELFNDICGSIGNCSGLDDLSSLQRQALEWLRSNANVAAYSVAAKIQRYALAIMYLGLNGDSWLSNDLWMTNVHECLWFQAESTKPPCSDARVLIRLHLPDNNLVGRLPTEISLLSSLTSVQLNDNSLSGSLPPEIGNMAGVRHILLQNNILTGDIPEGVGESDQLDLMRLDGNDLSGELPTQICDSSTLVFVDCDAVDTQSCSEGLVCCFSVAPCL